MKKYAYAGFRIRLAAQLIDLIVLAAACWVLLTMIYGSEYWLSDDLYHGSWDIFFSCILPPVATIWFWQRYLGTPGKLLLNLKVVDLRSGRKMSSGQSIWRYVAYLLSSIPLCFGLVWIAVDKRKQGWHDKLAGTAVIYEPRW